MELNTIVYLLTANQAQFQVYMTLYNHSGVRLSVLCQGVTNLYWL